MTNQDNDELKKMIAELMAKQTAMYEKIDQLSKPKRKFSPNTKNYIGKN